MFDVQKFEASSPKFKHREDTVPVPTLSKFFEEGEKPEFKIRGLEGPEIAVARQAMQTNRSLETMVEGLLSSNNDDKVQAIKDALGVASETCPDDYVYRVAVLYLGSVEPKLDQNQAVLIAVTNGVAFYNLTNKILQLTGMGKVLGE